MLGIEWVNYLAGYQLGEKDKELRIIEYAGSSYVGDLEIKKSTT